MYIGKKMNWGDLIEAYEIVTGKEVKHNIGKCSLNKHRIKATWEHRYNFLRQCHSF